MIKKLSLFILTFLFATVALSATTNDLPRDGLRGWWFQTIDLDAQDYAYTIVNDIVRKGESAIRFELRDGDCYTAYPENPTSGWDDCTRDRERAEIRERWNPPLDKSVWYSFSMFIPEDYEPMYPKQIFFQWHAGPSPAIYFHLNENKFHIDILGEVGRTTQQYTYGRMLELGVWNDFEVNIVWSGDRASGRMSLWVNGQRVTNYIGPTLPPEVYTNMLNGDLKTPEVKFGIYRSHLFRYEGERPHPTHVLYFDEYRRGLFQSDVDLDNYEGD